MAKQSGALLAIAGAFALLAMGKKKKKKGNGGSNGNGGSGGADDSGTTGGADNPGTPGTPGTPGSSSSSSGGGSSKPRKPPTKPSGEKPGALTPDALWVSSDCKTVEFGDETGELWWQNKGLPAAQKFVEANYLDPYEIAREMLAPIAPCAASFPLAFEVETGDELEYLREMFLREYPDVYYLIMTLYKQVSPLVGFDAFNLRFTEECKIEFAGFEWLDKVARGQLLFYLKYGYPLASDPGATDSRLTWTGADLEEKWASMFDNVVLAVVNRWSAECATAIMEAYKSGQIEKDSSWMGDGPRGPFFKNRQMLRQLYSEMFSMANELDTSRTEGLAFDFDPSNS